MSNDERSSNAVCQPVRVPAPETSGLVSVVIPAHRAERYIGTTLESVGKQTHADWELIVVEDGSSGPTEAIVAGFARRVAPRRVVFVRHDSSLGPAAARNTGMRLARGEFVAWLDADDRWLPGHLSTSLARLRSSGAEIAYSTVVMMADGSDVPLGLWGPTPAELAAFPQSLFDRSFVVPSATVMRRRVLEAVGSWNESPAVMFCEDFEYWLRGAAEGRSFVHVEGIHCLYRKNHIGAATRKLSMILTRVAQTAERFLSTDIPGVARRRRRRQVAALFALAARLHADPRHREHDPSADPRQAAWLAYRGWQLSPRRLRRLLTAGWYAVRFGVAWPPRTASTVDGRGAETLRRAA